LARCEVVRRSSEHGHSRRPPPGRGDLPGGSAGLCHSPRPRSSSPKLRAPTGGARRSSASTPTRSSGPSATTRPRSPCRAESAWFELPLSTAEKPFRPPKIAPSGPNNRAISIICMRLAEPADSGNPAPFGTVGSGPAVELRRGFELAEFGICGAVLN
jgi:hypothetical protein